MNIIGPGVCCRKVLASKPNDLRKIPGAHVLEGENQAPQAVFWPLHKSATGMHVHPPTQIINNFKINVVLRNGVEAQLVQHLLGMPRIWFPAPHKPCVYVFMCLWLQSQHLGEDGKRVIKVTLVYTGSLRPDWTKRDLMSKTKQTKEIQQQSKYMNTQVIVKYFCLHYFSNKEFHN